MLNRQEKGTAFFYHPDFQKHQTGWAHPEKRQRLTAIVEGLKLAKLWDLLKHPDAGQATLEQLTTVHDRHYVESIEQSCRAGKLFAPDGDTIGSPGTYSAALRAAGAVLSAADAVMAEQASNAFCAVRPPGHHAERDRAMGFCFFNNVAIGARYLQLHHGLDRIAIVDWDVHHGNGTQQAFYNDPSVLYFSIHQYPLYPGSGRSCETGMGAGKGFTVNCPLAGGATDADYRRIFREDLMPALTRFKPDFILISAGFDAHRDDPLAGMELTEQGFGDLTRLVKVVAAEHCGGRLVSVLEGGYDIKALTGSVVAHVGALLEAS